MKKLFLFIVLVSAVSFNAQHKSAFKGIGVFGALTQSAQYYRNTNDDHKTDSPYVYTGIYPPSHISKELFNWGAGIFLELSKRENVRWQTELEYTHTGAKEKELLNPVTGERNGSYTNNKLTYVQWNNYLKFYNPIGFAHWYIMPGIRLQYQLGSSVSAFTAYSGNFPKFWFSGDIGLGYEFPIFKKYSAFVEYHWNPDIISHKQTDTYIRSRTFELRAGLVLRPKKRSIDDCNVPVYKGPAY